MLHLLTFRAIKKKALAQEEGKLQILQHLLNVSETEQTSLDVQSVTLS